MALLHRNSVSYYHFYCPINIRVLSWSAFWKSLTALKGAFTFSLLRLDKFELFLGSNKTWE